jgi:hypothetical protein
MYRVATLLFCGALFLVAGVVAAPAPLPRTGPWFDGWDRPVNPLGDRRFERRGNRLSITVPGKDHEEERAPRLLRAVEGDFFVQVRVAGTFGDERGGRVRGTRAAGICVTDGRRVVSAVRLADRGGNLAPALVVPSLPWW